MLDVNTFYTDINIPDPAANAANIVEYTKVIDNIIMFNENEINPDNIGKNVANALEKYVKETNRGIPINPTQQNLITTVKTNITNYIAGLPNIQNPLNFEIPRLRENGRNELLEGFDFKPIELISKNEIIGQIIIHGILKGLSEFNIYNIQYNTIFNQFIDLFDQEIIQDPRIVGGESECVTTAKDIFNDRTKFRNQNAQISNDTTKLKRIFQYQAGGVIRPDPDLTYNVLTILKSDTYNLNFVYAAAAAESIYYITNKLGINNITDPNTGITLGPDGTIKQTIVKIFNDHPEYKPKIYDSIIKLLDENKTLIELINFSKPNYPKYMKDFLIKVNENLPFLNKLINVPQEISISKEKNLLIAYQDPDTSYFDYSLDMNPTNPILPVEDYDFILRNNGEDLTINNIKNLRFLYLKNAQLKSNNSNSDQYIFNSYKLEFFKTDNINYIFNNLNYKSDIFSILVFVILVPNINYFYKVWNIRGRRYNSFDISTINQNDFNQWLNFVWDDELQNIIETHSNHYTIY